jgi:hypothetical protein
VSGDVGAVSYKACAIRQSSSRASMIAIAPSIVVVLPCSMRARASFSSSLLVPETRPLISPVASN